MSSCSSTSVILEEPIRNTSRTIFSQSSFSELELLVRSDPSVDRWKQLPLTERLELVESLIEEQTCIEEDRLWNLMSALVLSEGSGSEVCVVKQIELAAPQLRKELRVRYRPQRESLTPYITVGIAVLCLLVITAPNVLTRI